MSMSAHGYRFRLLVLHARYTSRLSYYDDWLEGFIGSPLFDTVELNVMSGDAASRLRAELTRVDGIVLLHSVTADTTEYIEPLARILADRRCPLLSFVGNEVNLPGSPIREKRRVLNMIAPEWIATQLLREAGEFLFGDIAQRAIVAIPHALNPNVFKPARPQAERPIDVGTRSTRYLAHLGDDDRNRLLNKFIKLGSERSIRVDIKNIMLPRARWADFLNRCGTTVATEAGSRFIERDDATADAIRIHVRSRIGPGVFIANDSLLRRFGHKIPSWTRDILRTLLSRGPIRHESMINKRIDSQEIYQKFFAGRAYPPVYGKCISSRHFEAIGTKTLQIMFPGRFNDILVAGRHYVPMKPDFSNIDDVMDVIFSPKLRTSIVEEAYAHILDRHTYAHRVAQVHSLFAET